jgi:hypothetical protein
MAVFLKENNGFLLWIKLHAFPRVSVTIFKYSFSRKIGKIGLFVRNTDNLCNGSYHRVLSKTAIFPPKIGENRLK